MRVRIFIVVLLSFFTFKVSVGQTSVIAFQGIQDYQYIDLSWESLYETNTDYFTLERSLDSINYVFVKYVVAGGNTMFEMMYYETDSSVFIDTCYYYRLKITYFNASWEYLDTTKVCYQTALGITDNYTSDPGLNIYPNPVTKGMLNIELAKYENYILNIYNQNGQKILSLKDFNRIITVDCMKFNNGLYYLQLIKDNGKISTGKFIVE